MKRIWKDRIIVFIIIILSLYFANDARDFPARGGIFPLFSLVCMIMLSIGYLIANFVSSRKYQLVTQEDLPDERSSRPYILFLLVVVQVFLMDKVGYFVSTGLFFICSCVLMGLRRFGLILISMVIMLPAFYVFFTIILKAELPKGILF